MTALSPLHNLTMNTVPYPAPAALLEAAAAEVARAHEYPDMRGTRLAAAIADHVGVSPDRVLVGPGSAALCQIVLMSVCAPGDEIVYPWPSFEGYPPMIAHAGATGVPVQLDGDETDLAVMAKSVTERTKAILLCNPNNPTGTVFDEGRLREFLSEVDRSVLVIVDEAYRDFVTREGFRDALSCVDDHDNLCVLRTFSKSYRLAGLRVGYMITHPSLPRRLARMMPMFGVSGPGQAAAIAALGEDVRPEVAQRCTDIAAERDRLTAVLRERGWPIPDSHGNFVWLAAGEKAEPLAEFYAERGVLVRAYPGIGVRITVSTPQVNDLVAGIAGEYLSGKGIG
ncbi:aminotransferase class I/II-fold pyridoxal phosphate-dependent enzyme [Allokutzneria sp. A3M-2-11 16]|uniref:aminotransferase class I/II-fold pyridoxal phosphate-dependent enzyme n=1 Tax=Allokutzneria sp. A3M-2-11 16 TaxID=2962043 RepID=UPI0020B7155E|nr:aminotransferase class I/II-fold pyridoxal phosphate-dependent enzyme [Allokutzneria sp. A3M-2-11 16]MCP3805526.1 aminotransferase class I/II-fold pyridoxal phosphate-dependent enzyme [Allokutzneria sp. A3M-2-11 16]